MTPAAQLAVDVDRKRLRLALQQALRREHVADFRGADAEGQRAERAVRARVAVAADDGHARLREPEFRTDDVHDAAIGVPQPQQLDAELARSSSRAAHLPRGGVDRDGTRRTPAR